MWLGCVSCCVCCLYSILMHSKRKEGFLKHSLTLPTKIFRAEKSKIIKNVRHKALFSIPQPVPIPSSHGFRITWRTTWILVHSSFACGANSMCLAAIMNYKTHVKVMPCYQGWWVYLGKQWHFRASWYLIEWVCATTCTCPKISFILWIPCDASYESGVVVGTLLVFAKPIISGVLSWVYNSGWTFIFGESCSSGVR